MGVVAAGDEVLDPGELERQAQSLHVKVHGVVVELPQVLARRLVDVHPAVLEGEEAAIEAFRQIRSRAAEMAEDPADPGESIGDPGEDQLCRRQGRVHGEPDQGHQPVVHHRLHPHRHGGVDHEDSLLVTGAVVQGPESLIRQGNTVDIAEHHDPGEAQLRSQALELPDRGLRVAQRQGAQGLKTLVPIHELLELIIDDASKLCGALGLLDMGTRRGEGQDLMVHSRRVQVSHPILDVPMTRNHDVVVPRITQHRVAIVVLPDLELARAFLDSLQVLLGVEVVMEIENLHSAVPPVPPGLRRARSHR